MSSSVGPIFGHEPAETRGRVGSVKFASPIDAYTFGEHATTAAWPGSAPVRQFPGRITADGSSGHRAEPGRYHLYGGWFCPRSHRAAITIALNGLTGLVSVSYVDGLRDGRGWAFRERTGPDPVNGFTLLREAYETSRPGYTGRISVPVLWDRRTDRIVSNNPDTIDADLATAFAWLGRPDVDLYAVTLRNHIDYLSHQITNLGQTITRAVYHALSKDELRHRLRALDRRLETSRYLLGEALTLADVRLWVLLVRYDAGPNATGAAGPKLSTYPSLWAYARDLYGQPAFRDTTDFDAFTAPLTRRSDWTQPTERDQLSVLDTESRSACITGGW